MEHTFFTLSYDKVLFSNQIFKIGILQFSTFQGLLNPKITCLVVGLYVCVCASIVNITHEQSKAETRNLGFRIDITWEST